MNWRRFLDLSQKQTLRFMGLGLVSVLIGSKSAPPPQTHTVVYENLKSMSFLRFSSEDYM